MCSGNDMKLALGLARALGPEAMPEFVVKLLQGFPEHVAIGVTESVMEELMMPIARRAFAASSVPAGLVRGAARETGAELREVLLKLSKKPEGWPPQ